MSLKISWGLSWQPCLCVGLLLLSISHLTVPGPLPYRERLGSESFPSRVSRPPQPPPHLPPRPPSASYSSCVGLSGSCPGLRAPSVQLRATGSRFGGPLCDQTSLSPRGHTPAFRFSNALKVLASHPSSVTFLYAQGMEWGEWSLQPSYTNGLSRTLTLQAPRNGTCPVWSLFQ